MERAISREASVTTSKIQHFLFPSVTDLVFIMLAIAVPLVRAHSMLNSDGDLARHLRVGNYILDHHGLFYHDFLSYTVFGKSFIPYEWLSEVTFALVDRLGGLPAVVIFTALIIALTYALITHFLRSRGVDPLLALVVGLAAAIVSDLHWLARPHVFTSLAVVLLVILLERPEPRWRDLWLFGALFVPWTNLHGGFLFGLILIGVFFAGDLAEYLFGGRSAQWLARARWHGAALLTSLIACCVNPSGPLLFRHVTGYLGQTFLVNITVEYQSPNFHADSPKFFLLVLLVIVGGLALKRSRPSYPHLLTLLVTVAFALYSVRNVPLFAVSAMPLMALELQSLWDTKNSAIARVQQSFKMGDSAAATGIWSCILALVMSAVALNHGMALGTSLTNAQFDPAVFPVAAVSEARAANLQGHIFNEFPWGGYLLYAWPEQKVFIDGQTDLYGADITRQYVDIVDLQPGWRSLLDKWNVSLLIVQSNSPLANEVVHDGNWGVWYCDATAVILQRGASNRASGIKPDCALHALP